MPLRRGHLATALYAEWPCLAQQDVLASPRRPSAAPPCVRRTSPLEQSTSTRPWITTPYPSPIPFMNTPPNRPQFWFPFALHLAATRRSPQSRFAPYLWRGSGSASQVAARRKGRRVQRRTGFLDTLCTSSPSSHGEASGLFLWRSQPRDLPL